MRTALFLIATVIALTGAADAEAPRSGDDPKLAARQHVATARALHAQQRPADALVELETAYALDPQPQLLFAMGQLHVQLGRCERAITFYQRFLASNPKRDFAAVAREAIDSCKSAEPAIPHSVTGAVPVAVETLSVVEPAPPPGLAPTRPRTPEPPPHRHGHVLAGSLLAAGIGAAAGSLVLYRGALSDRDRATMASTYDDYADAVAGSDRRRTTAVILGTAGAAAITGGVIAFVLGRRTVQASGSPHGATVEWRMPF